MADFKIKPTSGTGNKLILESQDGTDVLTTSDSGVGHTYDKVNDVFISPKPYASWTLDASFDWQPPTAMPVDDKMYTWNEETEAWDEIE